jgi:hypothetical protein
LKFTTQKIPINNHNQDGDHNENKVWITIFCVQPYAKWALRVHRSGREIEFRSRCLDKTRNHLNIYNLLFLLLLILLVHFIITNFRLHTKCCVHLGFDLEIVLPRPQATSATIFLSVRQSTISQPWYTNSYF